MGNCVTTPFARAKDARVAPGPMSSDPETTANGNCDIEGGGSALTGQSMTTGAVETDQMDGCGDTPVDGPGTKGGKGGPTTKEFWMLRSDKKNQRVRAHGEADAANSKGDGGALSSKPSNDLTPENRRFLNKVLQKHFLFSSMEDDERNEVIDQMVLQKTSPQTVIFRQGNKGNSCYVIQSGTFMVAIDNKNLKQLRSKHTFGELAMLYNVDRTATVSCTQAGALWRMDAAAFRRCMETLNDRNFQKAMVFLSNDVTFGAMTEDERKLLAGACSVQTFAKNEVILRDGEVGDWMFIVMEGLVQTTDRYGNSSVKKPGTLLGAAGLIYSKSQQSAAKAAENATCLALGKCHVERLFGPIGDVLRRSAIKAVLVDNVNKSKELDFFRFFTDEQQRNVIDKLDNHDFNSGEIIMTPGARAQLLVVVEGEVAILNDGTTDAVFANLDKARKQARTILSSGQTFGGGALLQNSVMKDSAITLTNVRLHRIGYDAVYEALGEAPKDVIRLNEVKKVLSDIFLFKNLHEDQMERTVRSLERRDYAVGEYIVKQGDEACHFFLIQSGAITVTKDKARIRSMGVWDYFGERALLLSERRSATCQAETSCTCLVLSTDVFNSIVGVFRRELEHRMHLQDLDITMADLRLKAIVGRGSFGVVKLVFHRSDESRMYALKCVGKKQVVKQGQQKSMCIEREINAQCYHPCVMQFIKTFQDSKNVYFLTEFLGGGDLFYAIREIGNLSKLQSQFYGGSIVLALEYLHQRSIMYRDLKPENVLLDFKGNAKLVDFGCCKQTKRTNTLVGTPEYFAPETLIGKGYTCVIDWWALGVMMHEFVVGPLPFGRDTDDQLELFREIMEAPLTFPPYVTDSTALDVLSGFLERSPELRLGASTRGAKEIKEHPYFTGFDWDALAGRYMVAPWIPNQDKLKKNWEIIKGDKVLDEGGGGSDPGIEDASMDWARVF